MNLRQLLLTKNQCYISGQSMTPKGIMVHSTGANNPNLKRYVGPDDGYLGFNSLGNHWNTQYPSGISVCVHAFIGKLANGSIATYQTLPWTMRAWHGGSGSKGSVNNTHIGFEICEDDLTSASYFNSVYKEAVELCVYLCQKYNLNPKSDGVLICHSEGYTRGIASNHADVMHWFPKYGKNMNIFRNDVANMLAGSDIVIDFNDKDPNGCPYGISTDLIRNGSTGNTVKRCQWYLNEIYNLKLVEDGICGTNTVNGIKKFQTDNKLTVDGICGINTWNALQKVLSDMKNKDVTIVEQPKTDIPSTTDTPSSWAKEAVDWAINNGILKGNETGLHLNDNCTKEEVIVLLKRLYDILQ